MLLRVIGKIKESGKKTQSELQSRRGGNNKYDFDPICHWNTNYKEGLSPKTKK